MSESPTAHPTDPFATIPPPGETATVPPAPPTGDTATLPPRADVGPGEPGPLPPGYELLGELGRGGMGVVYKARDTRLGRIVALKMVLSGAHAADRDLARFQAEAEAVARLSHPHVVPIFEIGRHAGLPYFTLEFCPGGTLADKVRAAPLAPTDAARVVAQVARGVAAAHAAGVVHRDLKPENVLLAADGTPKVTDFGLAKRVEGDSGLTHTGAIMGTPSYMAPEQAGGKKDVGPAADVYAIGAVLYRLVAGRPPFQAATPLDTVLQVVSDEVVPPTRLNPLVPRDLETIALKCLQKEPAKRYATAGDLADDLDRFLDGRPILARPVGRVEKAWKWARRRPAAAALITLGIVSLMVVVGGSVAGVTILARKNADIQGARDEAETNARVAAASEERTKDELCRGRFEQARALRLAGRPGWRATALDRLREAAALQRRPRDGDLPADLPTLADLRGEAVMALIGPDATRVREVRTDLRSLAVASGDGRVAAFPFARGAKTPLGVRVVDLATGADIARLEPAPGAEVIDHRPIAALDHLVALDRTGVLVAVRPREGHLGIRELPSGKLLATLRDDTPPARPRKDERPFLSWDEIHDAIFTPDGKKVLAVRYDVEADDTRLVLWDLVRPGTPTVLERWSDQDDRIDIEAVLEQEGHAALDAETGVAMSADGSRVCCPTADRKALRLIDLTRSPPADVARLPVADVRTAAWHPTRPLLVLVVADGKNGRRVVLWDLDRNAETARAEEHFRGPTRIAYAPDGRLLAVCCDDTRVRMLGGADLIERHRVEDAATAGRVLWARWSAAGDLVTFCLNESVRVWRPAADRPVEALRGLPAPSFSADGHWLAARTGPKFGLFPRPGDPAPAVVLFDRRAGRVAHRWEGVDDLTDDLVFSPSGDRLAHLSARRFLAWSTVDGKQVLDAKPPPVGKAADSWGPGFFAPDGRLLGMCVTGADGKRSLTLWDVAARVPVATYPDTFLRPDVYSMVVSPGGRILIRDQNVGVPRPVEAREPFQVVELPAGRLVGGMPPAGAGRALALGQISADGRRAIVIDLPEGLFRGVGSDITLVVRSLPGGEELVRVPVTHFENQRADRLLSPDGRYLVAYAETGTVGLWDLDARTLLFRWQPFHGGAVGALTFAPTGEIAATTRKADDVTILSLPGVRARLAELSLDW
jgi:WD40 repeat protein